MNLDFELCDLEQNVLTRLDNRRAGSRVELGLNSYRRGICPVSLEDPARALVESTDTVLRVTLNGPDDFSRVLSCSRVTIPEEVGSSDSEGLTINSTDELATLDSTMIKESAAVPHPWPWIFEGGNAEFISTTTYWRQREFAATEQSTLLWTLISESDIETIEAGTLEGSVSRDRTYPPGKYLGEALVEMSDVEGGPDFELEPVIRENGILSRFNTFYPRQGDDLSATIRFVYGANPETATAFTYSPGGPVINQVLAVGQPYQFTDGIGDTYVIQLGYTVRHEGSIAQYGTFDNYLPLEDVTEGATLEAHAKSAIVAEPIEYFSFTAAPEQVLDETGEGVPAVFGRDYWIGDTIGLDVHEPDGVVRELSGRITDAVVTEADSGQLSVVLTCAPEIDISGVTGELITVMASYAPSTL